MPVSFPRFRGCRSDARGREMGPDGPTVAKFVGDFLKKELDNYLHRDRDTAEIVLRKIQESDGHCCHHAVADIGRFERAVVEVLHSACHRFLEGAQVRASLGGVLAVSTAWA